MKNIFLALITVFMVFAIFPAANAAIITFDNLPGSENLIPNGYNGLNWNNFYAFNPVESGYSKTGIGAGYLNGLISPLNVAFNGYGENASITDTNGTFNFTGGYFISAWYNNNILDITAYSKGLNVGSDILTLNTSNPVYATFNFNNVNEVTFSSSNAQFAMDNVNAAVNTPPGAAAPVPEPSAILFVIFTVVGLLLIKKNKLKFLNNAV